MAQLGISAEAKAAAAGNWPLRISIGVGEMLGRARTIDGMVEEVRQAERLGFTRAWIAESPWMTDALTIIALAGREVGRIELGTAVVAVPPRHPAVLAQQALTVQAATHGRLLLGVGLSHRVLIEDFYGLSYERPVAQIRDYLGILEQLMHRGVAEREPGQRMKVQIPEGMPPPPLYLAALGPKMLSLCGTRTSGTITWLTGPRTLANHIRPSLDSAAAAAGRPGPEVVAGLPICVTDDPAGGRERVAQRFEMYRNVPSYRAMMDREAVGGPEDVALIGDEERVGEAIAELAAAGATELLAVVCGTEDERARTLALLGTPG